MLWWQWALIGVASFLVGISKTGIAGLGIFAVVIFASVLPARESVGAVLVTLIAGDIVAVSTYRRDASWSHLRKLFPWAAVGVIIGALVVGQINDLVMRRLIGVIVVGLILFQLYRQFRGLNKDLHPPQQRWLVWLTGLAAGFTTMIANASGPIMVLYLLGQRLPKLLFIGTSAWFFLILNLFKVPFAVGLGMISSSSLPISLAMIPFTIAGALFGRRLFVVIDQQLFEKLAIWLSLLAGLRLLW